MAEAECMNCCDSFEPEHSRSDNVCNFCNPPNEYEDLHQCSHCSIQSAELFYFEGEEAIGYCLECSNELNEEDRFLAC